MLIPFIRTLILYIVIIAAIRLMGKRQVGELQPSELDHYPDLGCCFCAGPGCYDPP